MAGVVAGVVLGLVGCASNDVTGGRPTPRLPNGPTAALAAVPLPNGSREVSRSIAGPNRISADYDVPTATAVEIVGFYRRQLLALGWRERTLHAPTGTSAGGTRRADFVAGPEYLQVTAVPIPEAFAAARGFVTRLTLILTAPGALAD